MSEVRFEPHMVLAESGRAAFEWAKYRVGDVIDGKEVTSVDVTAIQPGRYKISYGWRRYDPVASLLERSSFVLYAGAACH